MEIVIKQTQGSEEIEKQMFKSTVMQIEKALINDRLHVSKAFLKIRIPNIYNFAVIYP